jgi:hypothetical protein
MNEKLLQPSAEARPAPRPLLIWLGLPLLAVLLIYSASRLVSDPTVLGLADYIAYWSAGYVSIHGGHPYSIDELAQVQYDTGWRRDDTQVTDKGLPWPNVMYYPPWTLTIVIPFGLLPYGLSRLLWLIFHLALCLGCADVYWRYCGGPVPYRWVSWLLCFTFLPTLIVLKIGQIAPLILLGVVGFLVCEKPRGQRRLDWLAGAAASLVVIKPHLTYLFGPALLLWAVERRRWSVLLGAVLTGLAFMALPWLLDPQLFQGYFDTSLHHLPRQNKCPTVSTVLRLLVDEKAFWLSFVPTVLGLVWFAFYWRRHPQTWDWSEQLPILLFVSFLTTSYGAWSFDLVVLLVPVIQMAVWLWHNPQRLLVAAAVGCYVILNVLMLVINLLGVDYMWFIWVTPLLFVAYLVLRGQIGPKAAAATVPVG